MPPINAARVAAAHDGPIVVFLIGMRINRLFPLGRWLKVARSMPRMIAELEAHPASGYLHGEALIQPFRTVLFAQYWQSFEALEAYARDQDKVHWPAWRAFNKDIGSDGSVGIFHETYLVPAQGFESIYVNMPPWGLGAASGTVPATGNREAARQRLKRG